MELTPELLAKAKEMALALEWKIKPIEIDGEKYYAVIWHPVGYDLFRKMMAKSSWQRKQHLKRLLKRKIEGLNFIKV